MDRVTHSQCECIGTASTNHARLSAKGQSPYASDAGGRQRRSLQPFIPSSKLSSHGECLQHGRFCVNMHDRLASSSETVGIPWCVRPFQTEQHSRRTSHQRNGQHTSCLEPQQTDCSCTHTYERCAQATTLQLLLRASLPL